MTTKALPQVGDRVTFFHWHGGHEGTLHESPATVIAVHPPELVVVGYDRTGQEITAMSPFALTLDVELTDEIKALGITTTQNRMPERTRIESDIHASGSWSHEPEKFAAAAPAPAPAA